MLRIKFPLPFKDAIKAAEARKVVLPEQYYSDQFTALMRAAAFSIAKMAQVDQIAAVLQFMNKVLLKEGGTLQDFKKQAAQMKWNLPAWRLELIMRNHMQNAYQVGHWEAFMRNKANRPYLMYDAVNDNRTRPAHRALDGTIKPVDDPFWDTYSPPLGYNCRCSLRSLTEEQVKAKGGVTPGVPPGAVPDPGWGYHPLKARDIADSLLDNKLAKMPPQFQKPEPKPVPKPPTKMTLDEVIAVGKSIREAMQLYTVNKAREKLGLSRRQYFKMVRKELFGTHLKDVQFGGKVNCSGYASGLGNFEKAVQAYPTKWIEKGNMQHVFVNTSTDVKVRGGFLQNLGPPSKSMYIGTHELKYAEQGITSYYFADRTFIHEYAHKLQADMPQLDAYFQELHTRRTAKDATRKLSVLTGKNYADWEVSKPDGYVNAYMGKEYAEANGVKLMPGKRALEVMSMAFETVLDSTSSVAAELFFQFVEQDPELFDLTIGLLKRWVPK